MTYGENIGEMREAMTSLLRWHRILQQLGGPARHPIRLTTTHAEREKMSVVIQRYRLAALTWCLEAVTATTPKIDSNLLSQTAAEKLKHRLRSEIEGIRPGEPLLDLLAAHHDNHLLGAWQRLARAAALGEHDFGAGVNRGGLTLEQGNTVLKDAADVARGMVVLDRRYGNVPGWVHLKRPVRLDRAAEAAALVAGETGLDPSVAERGWRPLPGRIEGPALPGIAGAVQAQHNMLVELGRLPNALNLRRVLLSQAQVSHEAARHASVAAPDLVDGFSDRASLYRDLVRASRDIGGLVGGGGQAAVESHSAAARLRRAEVGPAGEEPLRDLARLMTATDARIRVTVEHGFAEQLYFVSVQFPRLADHQVAGVFPVRDRWMPVTSELQTDFLMYARQRLRPPAAISPASADGVASSHMPDRSLPLARQRGSESRGVDAPKSLPPSIG